MPLPLIPIIIGGAVRLVTTNAAKQMVKRGAKYLTKENFKKSYEFFRGNKLLKSSEKNKILKKLKINPAKEVKEKVISKKAPVKTVSKDTVPQPASISKVKETLSGTSADKGAKIVEEATKKSMLTKTRELLFPNPFKKTFPYVTGRGVTQYGLYYVGGEGALDMHEGIKTKAAEDERKIEETKKLKVKKEKDDKLYEKEKKETTLGVIDLNTLVDTNYKLKTDSSGNFITD